MKYRNTFNVWTLNKYVAIDMMPEGSHHDTAARIRGSSKENDRLDVGHTYTSNDDVFDFATIGLHSVSQPVTLERTPKGHKSKSNTKHETPILGHVSLPRSPFFGGQKKETGCLNIVCMILLISKFLLYNKPLLG